MTVTRVSAREALEEWDFYEGMINKVIRRVNGGVSAEHVLTCLQQGNMQLWRDSSRKGIGVTEIQTYPEFRTLLIFMVAGEDARAWLTSGQQQLDSFAQKSGCKYVEYIGRPGWERLLRDFGYTEKYIRMRKEVDNG